MAHDIGLYGAEPIGIQLNRSEHELSWQCLHSMRELCDETATMGFPSG
jgi:hypothetical protein